MLLKFNNLEEAIVFVESLLLAFSQGDSLPFKSLPLTSHRLHRGASGFVQKRADENSGWQAPRLTFMTSGLIAMLEDSIKLAQW